MVSLTSIGSSHQVHIFILRLCLVLGLDSHRSREILQKEARVDSSRIWEEEPVRSPHLDSRSLQNEVGQDDKPAAQGLKNNKNNKLI